jgi:hypothetical protein
VSISRAHMCMPRLNVNWRRGAPRLARSSCAQLFNDSPRRTITIRYSCVMSDFRRSSPGISAAYATPRARERIWAPGSSHKTASSNPLSPDCAPSLTFTTISRAASPVTGLPPCPASRTRACRLASIRSAARGRRCQIFSLCGRFAGTRFCSIHPRIDQEMGDTFPTCLSGKSPDGDI